MPTSHSRACSPLSTSSAGRSTSSQNPRNDALRGASLAFSRSTPNPTAPTTASVLERDPLSNGALAAAVRSGGKGPGSQSSKSPQSMSGTSAADATDMKERGQQFTSRMSQLGIPREARPPKSRSPSQQAAVLASARAHPTAAALNNDNEVRGRSRAVTTSKPAVAPKPRRLSDHVRKNALATTDQPTDTTSIAPTTSLVDMFERRSKESQAQNKRPETLVIKPSEDLALKSPKPMRSGITSMFQLELQDNRNRQTPEQSKTAAARQDAYLGKHDGNSSYGGSFASAPEDPNAQSPEALPVTLPIRRALTTSPSPGQLLKMDKNTRRHLQNSPSSSPQSASRPIPIKQPRATTARPESVSSMRSSRSPKTIGGQYYQAYPRKMTALTTGDDLANALVASSLASSRAASPTKLDVPPVPAHRKKNHHSMLSFSRTPSPAKGGMLHTLRKVDSSSESEDEQHPYGKHRKKRLVRKAPNKHHEGDRKRWRDAVTERERKRYEGVWAANKGIHYSFTYDEQDFFRRSPMHQRTLRTKAAATEQVSNIVARDIWTRSRLPESALEVVWDLVDSDSVGRLHKEEFVVGMWLIDQRLKGRKLPVKVSETVWASVRGIQGIKIRK